MKDEELIELNKKGYFPGPEDDDKTFLKRVALSQDIFNKPEKYLKNNLSTIKNEKLKAPNFSWTKSHLLYLYDFAPENMFVFFSNKKLSFFQGGATWLFEKENVKLSVLQLRKKLKKGSYIGIYTLDEILAHEAVHWFRCAYEEPKTEEFFAYLTSSSSIRKVLGPIIRNHYEPWLFLSSIFLNFTCQFLSIFTGFDIFGFFSHLFLSFSIILLTYGVLRLFFTRLFFNKTYKKLKSLVGKKALAVMVRLTDKEIKYFSKISSSKIKKYIYEKSENSLRHKALYLSYFKCFSYKE